MKKTIKIDKELYSKIKEVVNSKPEVYSAPNDFVEKTAMHALGMVKYDIESIPYNFKIYMEPLKELIKHKKNFTICVICQRAFLKDKDDLSEEALLCHNCNKVVTYFIKKNKGKKTKKEKK